MRKIAYVILPVLIVASFSVLPVSIALGQAGGAHNAVVTVTAVPDYIYTPLITDVSASVDVNGVFTEEVTTASADGLLQLSIPAGTTGLTAGGDPLSQISNMPVEDPPPPPVDSNVIGLVYDLGPDGATFNPPINLTFTYNESLIPDGVAEEDLVIAMWDAAGGTWVELVGVSIDPVTNEITGLVSGFTEFTVLAYTPTEPEPEPEPTPPAPGGGGGGGGIRISPPKPLVTAGGMFTQRAILYSGDALVQLVFKEGTIGLTNMGIPLSEMVPRAEGETYITEMGDVYIVKMDDPPPPPEDARIVGMVYDFGPDGATFNPPVTITLTYDESFIPEGVAEEHLIPAWWDAASEQWLPLEVFIVNSELNIITAPISHFTPFTILAYLHPVEFATFTASNLLVMPAEVDVGEPVNIVLSVTNTGGQSGSLVVRLKINGLVEAIEEVTIAAGNSELVSFNIVKNTAGTYSLEVAGFTGVFTVREEPAPPVVTPPSPPPTTTLPPLPPPVDWTIIGGIIAAIALSGAMLLYALRIMRQYKYAVVAHPVEVERPIAPPIEQPIVAPPAPEPVAYPPAGISIREVIGRVMAVVALPVVGGVRLLVKILRAIGIVLMAIATATAVGTRFVVSKAAIGVAAASTGSGRLLVSVVRATGRGMLVVARTTAAGARNALRVQRRHKEAAITPPVEVEAPIAPPIEQPIVAPPAPEPVAYPPPGISIREVIGRMMAVVAAPVVGGARLVVNILRAIGRGMVIVASSTAAGTRFAGSKAAIGVAAVALGSGRLLVSVVRAAGRVMLVAAGSTAAGTRFVGSKAAIGVAAVALGSGRLLVSVVRAAGRVMLVAAGSTAAGTRLLVSKVAVGVAAVALGSGRLLVSVVRAIGRGVVVVTGATAAGTRLLVSKVAVGVAAASTGSGRLLVSIVGATGRGVVIVARSTAAGTRFAGSKAAIGVAAVALGSGRFLVSVVRATGRVMLVAAGSTAAGTRLLVSQLGVAGRASATVAAAIVKWARLLLGTLLSGWK